MNSRNIHQLFSDRQAGRNTWPIFPTTNLVHRNTFPHIQMHIRALALHEGDANQNIIFCQTEQRFLMDAFLQREDVRPPTIHDLANNKSQLVVGGKTHWRLSGHTTPRYIPRQDCEHLPLGQRHCTLLTRDSCRRSRRHTHSRGGTSWHVPAMICKCRLHKSSVRSWFKMSRSAVRSASVRTCAKYAANAIEASWTKAGDVATKGLATPASSATRPTSIPNTATPTS